VPKNTSYDVYTPMSIEDGKHPSCYCCINFTGAVCCLYPDTEFLLDKLGIEFSGGVSFPDTKEGLMAPVCAQGIFAVGLPPNRTLLSWREWHEQHINTPVGTTTKKELASPNGSPFLPGALFIEK
jgi:hypothetical protein